MVLSPVLVFYYLKWTRRHGQASRRLLEQGDERLLDEVAEEALVLQQDLPLVRRDVHVNALPLSPVHHCLYVFLHSCTYIATLPNVASFIG